MTSVFLVGLTLAGAVLILFMALSTAVYLVTEWRKR